MHVLVAITANSIDLIQPVNPVLVVTVAVISVVMEVMIVYARSVFFSKFRNWSSVSYKVS